MSSNNMPQPSSYTAGRTIPHQPVPNTQQEFRTSGNDTHRNRSSCAHSFKSFLIKVKNVFKCGRSQTNNHPVQAHMPTESVVRDRVDRGDEQRGHIESTDAATLNNNQPLVGSLLVPSSAQDMPSNVSEGDGSITADNTSTVTVDEEPRDTPTPEQVRDAEMAQRQAVRSRRLRHELNLNFDDQPPKREPPNSLSSV